MVGLEGNAVRVRTYLAAPAVTSAEVTWGEHTRLLQHRCISIVLSFSIFHSYCCWFPFKITLWPFLLSVSVIPSPSAPPVRLCPPLSSPEDASINLFTAAGFLSYIQSTTRRAYQQVLEVLDDSHRRCFLFLFVPESLRSCSKQRLVLFWLLLIQSWECSVKIHFVM